MGYFLAAIGLAFSVFLSMVIWLSAAPQAQAYDQSFCASIAEAHIRLEDAGEYPAIAVRAVPSMLLKIIYINPKTLSGTIINVAEDGTACTGVEFQGARFNRRIVEDFFPGEGVKK